VVSLPLLVAVPGWGRGGGWSCVTPHGWASWPPLRQAATRAVQVIVDVLGVDGDSSMATPSRTTASSIASLEEAGGGTGLAKTPFERVYTSRLDPGLREAIEAAAHSDLSEERQVQFALFAGQEELGMASCDLLELARQGGTHDGTLPIQSACDAHRPSTSHPVMSAHSQPTMTSTRHAEGSTVGEHSLSSHSQMSSHLQSVMHSHSSRSTIGELRCRVHLSEPTCRALARYRVQGAESETPAPSPEAAASGYRVQATLPAGVPRADQPQPKRAPSGGGCCMLA